MTSTHRSDYQSDITKFIHQLRADKPKLEGEQLAGRGLLWDKAIDREAAADIALGQVLQKPYVYSLKSVF